MNAKDPLLGSFEERLLRDLKDVVAHGDPLVDHAFAHPMPRRRPQLVAAGGVAATAAATAAAAVIAGSGDTPAAAYAIASRGASVTVEIAELRDAAGLQRDLRAAGVPAQVDYLPDGMACRQPRYRRATPRSAAAEIVKGTGGALAFRVDRAALRPGQTVVISTGAVAPGAPKPAARIALDVAQGPVAACDIVPARGRDKAAAPADPAIVQEKLRRAPAPESMPAGKPTTH